MWCRAVVSTDTFQSFDLELGHLNRESVHFVTPLESDIYLGLKIANLCIYKCSFHAKSESVPWLLKINNLQMVIHAGCPIVTTSCQFLSSLSLNWSFVIVRACSRGEVDPGQPGIVQKRLKKVIQNMG
jgi:hypothetical protein